MCGRCNNCKGCNGANRDPDSMRHGGFRYEVRGSDRAATVAHGASSLARAPTNHNPITNQSESGITVQSAFGRAMRASAPALVRQMGPLYYAHRYNGNIGVTPNPRVANNPLALSSGYEGVLPLTEQPIINKPLPYL